MLSATSGYITCITAERQQLSSLLLERLCLPKLLIFAKEIAMAERAVAFRSQSSDRVLQQLQSRPQGLSSAEAQSRFSQFGSNTLSKRVKPRSLLLLLNQFKSPITLILIAAALLSGFLGNVVDTVIILFIVLASGLLGF